MKFQQLPMGARFEFEGVAYVKTGPLTATSERGRSRMIPRSAVLKPLDAPIAPPVRAARVLDEAVVMAAFEVFHDECRRLLDAADSDLARAATARAMLESARRRFLDALV